MAGYDISVGIGVEGETQFKKTLTECQNSVKQLDSALKANAAEYEANAEALGENVEKTRLLKESVALQKRMVEGLGKAIEYSNKEYGEASAQTTKYVIAQNKAREAVAKMEKELSDMDREMEEVGRDSRKVGRQLEQGIGEGAEDAAKKLSWMMEDIRGELSDIGSSVGITATIDVIKNVGEGIQDLTEETQEYRRITSYLEQNTKDAGQAWADVEAHLFRVAANTGSLEDASEGISNLLAAGLDSAEVADAVNMLLGAVIKFPETYKFEGLAESLRNTIEEKKAVGQFSEMLLGLGVDLETFNKALEKTTTKEAAQDLVLSFGANRGLEQTITEYETVNQQMLEANTATLEYKKSLAELGTQMGGLGEAWTGMATAAVETVTTILENSQVDEWAVEVLNNIKESIEAIGILADEEKRKQHAEEKNEERREMVESGEAETEGEAALRQMGKPEWFIQYYREQARKNGETAGTETVQGMVKEIEAGAPDVKAEAGKMVDEISKTVEDSGDDMKTAEDKALEQLFVSFGENTPGIIDAAQSLADGITGALNSIVWPDIAGMLNTYKRTLQTKPVYDESTTNYFPGGRIQEDSKTMHISMYMDTTKVAEVITPAVSGVQGMQIDRFGTLNA